eukprot:SAG31_NODE_12774_length_918_cov_0.811966_2_plen_230_part_00
MSMSRCRTPAPQGCGAFAEQVEKSAQLRKFTVLQSNIECRDDQSHMCVPDRQRLHNLSLLISICLQKTKKTKQKQSLPMTKPMLLDDAEDARTVMPSSVLRSGTAPADKRRAIKIARVLRFIRPLTDFRFLPKSDSIPRSCPSSVSSSSSSCAKMTFAACFRTSAATESARCWSSSKSVMLMYHMTISRVSTGTKFKFVKIMFARRTCIAEATGVLAVCGQHNARNLSV